MENTNINHVQQDLFEWTASIRDKLTLKGARPSYIYSPYKTKHNLHYGEDELGEYAVISFKMPDGVLVQFQGDEADPTYGYLEGFRVYLSDKG